MSKKKVEAGEQRQKCDAGGWCFVMSAAVDASSGVCKGFYVAEMIDRSNPRADLKQELVYGLRNHGWAPPRLCPFCEGNPNARFKVDEVTP